MRALSAIREQYQYSMGLYKQVSRDVKERGYQNEAVKMAIGILRSTSNLISEYKRDHGEFRKATIDEWNGRLEKSIRKLEEIIDNKPFYQGKSGGNTKAPIHRQDTHSTAARSQPTRVPGYNLEAKKMFDQHLSHDFDWVDVPGNGNCFFYAVVGQIYPPARGNKQLTEGLMLDMRNQIADHMEARNDKYSFRIDGDFKEHLHNLRESSFGKADRAGQGEFIHAKVLSKMTGRPVHIYSPDDPDIGHDQDIHGRALPGDNYRFQGQGEPIRLIYNGKNHWLHVETKA